MHRLLCVMCVVSAVPVSLVRGQAGPPVDAGEKRELLAQLTSPNASNYYDKLANMGPRILPILLEVVTSEKHDHYDRAQAFRVVQRMKGVPKDDFVAAAAKSLATTESVRFAMAAVQLIEESKDSKYAPSVCCLLLRVAREGGDGDVQFASRIARALGAIGTGEELKMVEEWLRVTLAPKQPGEFDKRDEQAVRDAMAEAAKQLRAKLKK